MTAHKGGAIQSRSMARRIAAQKGLPIPMFSKGDTAMDAYAERVRQLEAEGMITSDAQSVADVEEAKEEGAKMFKHKHRFDPLTRIWMNGKRMIPCRECKQVLVIGTLEVKTQEVA